MSSTTASGQLPPSTSTTTSSSPPIPTITSPLSSSSSNSLSTTTTTITSSHHFHHSNPHGTTTIGRKSPSVISLTSDVNSIPSSSSSSNLESSSQQQQQQHYQHSRNISSSSTGSSKVRTHHHHTRTESLSNLYLEAHLEAQQILENNSAQSLSISGADKIHYKIVVLGDEQSGKTSLINRYISNAFERTYTPTIIESFSTSINSNQTDFHLVLWELSSLDSYAEMRPLSYSNVDLFFLCFDVSRPETLRSIKKKWIPEITKYCPEVSYLVVGCKTDLRRIFPSQQKSTSGNRKSIIHRTSLNSSPVSASASSTPPKTAKSDSNLSMRELDELSGSMGSDYSFSSSNYDRPMTARPHTRRLDITSSGGGGGSFSNSRSSMMNESRGNLSPTGSSSSPSSFVKKRNIGLSILNALGKSKDGIVGATNSPPSPVNNRNSPLALNSTTTDGSNGSTVDIVIDSNEIEIDFSPSKEKQQDQPTNTSPNRSRGYSTNRSRSMPTKDSWTNYFRHSVSAEKFEAEFLPKTPRELFMEEDCDTMSPRDSIALPNNGESVSYIEARKFATKVQACGYIECSAKITLDFKAVINDGFTQFLENRTKKKKSCVVM
ncbi:hypothetical protein C9374_007580 [Naegleria lovaniensis]|uniref:Rho family small GTPase n=1 Tax=Naegleria lovaniensis TaxID=51637 RepID=A0AA88KG68_NAELO|nr:uncharacterized protein C9374_007580 [Naegleria lovaniensis]KAG2378942.1 hypothetical protein C9374_007580 [Naegleria lovaniensis]